eukprot:TRINITY_DN26602_c0_g1_i1.p1 TRINITY_DN26602_c0_g1~~TRINITY_DN26602_c0_g1_i1.p1  ORF type:complete len:276 (-),score=72.09 TRINITY_DN26602_c0_g1_i1:444-1178(-)
MAVIDNEGSADGPASAPAAAASEEQRSWKEAAGRAEGGDGYVFGDVTRNLVRRGSAALQEWASKPKESEGYEFGDLLKPLLRGFSCEDVTVAAEGSEIVVPPSDAAAAATAAGLAGQRQLAIEQLERCVGLLGSRREQLEKKAKEEPSGLDATELSEVVRLRGLTEETSPLHKYQRMLDELVASSSQFALDEAFVVAAEKSGQLSALQSILDKATEVARESEQCCAEVRALPAVPDITPEQALG